jgi:hypothetical protein
MKRFAENVGLWEYLTIDESSGMLVELPDCRETAFSESECKKLDPYGDYETEEA